MADYGSRPKILHVDTALHTVSWPMATNIKSAMKEHLLFTRPTDRNLTIRTYQSPDHLFTRPTDESHEIIC